MEHDFFIPLATETETRAELTFPPLLGNRIEHQSQSKLRLCFFHVDYKRGTRPLKFGFDGIEVRARSLELCLADDAATLGSARE